MSDAQLIADLTESRLRLRLGAAPVLDEAPELITAPLAVLGDQPAGQLSVDAFGFETTGTEGTARDFPASG